MSFQIKALPAGIFRHLFSQSSEALAARNVLRMVVDKCPGFPCRLSLRDAEPGETVLLLNYEHQDAATPYRASHAIFVCEGAGQAVPAVDEVPEVLRSRLLSVRGFSAAGMMLAADVVAGAAVAPAIGRMFGDREIAYLHLHYAKPGCYAARVDRV